MKGNPPNGGLATGDDYRRCSPNDRSEQDPPNDMAGVLFDADAIFLKQL